MDKKNYGVFKNIIFTHKYILQEYKSKYWLSAVIVILCHVFVAYMLTLLPAYAVELLTEQSSIFQVLLKLTFYCLILYSTTIMYRRLEITIDNNIDMRRMFKCLDYYDNIMTTNYQNIDSSRGREIFNAGISSYMDDFHIGFSYMIVDFRTLTQSILGFSVYCFFIARINILVSIVLVLISSFSMIVNIWNERWINKNKKKWIKIDTKLRYLSVQSTSINNAKDIRLYNIKNWFMDTFQHLVSLRQDWLKKELRIYYLINVSERVLTAIKYFIAYFIVFTKVKNGLDISQFIMIIGLVLGINNWITGIFDNIKYLQLNNITVNDSRTAIEIDDIKSENMVRNDLCNSYKQIQTEKSYELRFEDVSFAFPESETKIFDKFNLTIHRGEKLAIVGVNGAGKTTLVKLMCGLYKPIEGKIYLDGVDISTYKREDYFKLFSIVFQDFQVLALSVAENISCSSKEKTDYDRVNKCIELSGLKDRVGKLRDGVNTNMLKELDDGVVFSGGETQKLMLARCLYKDSPIIILDEPTSALDALAESEIYERYGLLIEDKTNVFISHRLSSTKFCDRIIVLDGGQIIEEGTHDELITKNGEYTKMFNIQSSYYQEGVPEIA